VNDLSAAFVDPSAAPPAALGESARRSVGPALEFLVVGGGTLLLLPLCWWYRRAFGTGEGELLMGMLAFHAASLINDPHFAATYLLFYRDAKARAFGTAYAPKQRARYRVAAVLVPLVLLGWSALALAAHSAPTLGALIQLSFLLVGWHYVKQGFGVLSVLSARRGIAWSRGERRVLLGHCFAGWAYAWASPFDPGTRSVVNGVLYTTLPHPPGLELVSFTAFAASAVAALAVVARKWQRERRAPPLAPLAGLAITVWLWTVYTRFDPLLMYWIPALHSLQYLYFVALLRRNAALEAAGPPSFKGSVGRELAVLAASALGLGWLLLRGAPAWVDAALVPPAAPASGNLPAIGPTPYLAAFTAAVNIHHYFMDSVIWRREHAETRHLLTGVSVRESLVG
jgi:multisubunit Na+/H+ antiporter MnhB subunit